MLPHGKGCCGGMQKGEIAMRNIFKNLDMEQITDRVSDIKDQVGGIRYRRPWTTGSGNGARLAFVGLGAALAVTAILAFRNRKQVARFCAQCGTDLMDKIQNTPLKERAGKIMDKMNGSGDAHETHQENFQAI